MFEGRGNNKAAAFVCSAARIWLTKGHAVEFIINRKEDESMVLLEFTLKHAVSRWPTIMLPRNLASEEKGSMNGRAGQTEAITTIESTTNSHWHMEVYGTRPWRVEVDCLKRNKKVEATEHY